TLLIMSVIGAPVVIKDVMSAPLIINAVIHETVIPTLMDPTPRCATPLEGTITGNGTSPLLGKVSFEAHDCITPAGTSLSFIGKMVFTMLSGDELFADYGGSFTPTSYPSVYTLTKSSFTITGGTGSFLNAKGGGTLQGVEKIDPSLLTGLGLMQATGTISNFKTSKDYSEPKTAFQSIAAATDPLAAIAELNTSLTSSSTTTLGHYFHQDQSESLLAVNPLPESSSWALVGIGLAGLAIMRRRKLIIGNLEKTG
ncbi:MAG TPA: PEP-CTERM sorting domain-containing protein, partial [Nitrosospira sp.]